MSNQFLFLAFSLLVLFLSIVWRGKDSGVEVKICPYNSSNVISLPMNYVHRHAMHFATMKNTKSGVSFDGDLTSESMTAGHSCRNITDGVALKVKAINNMIGDRNLPRTVAGIGSIPNPASTGIWRPDGTVNQKVLNNILAGAIDVGGKKIILRRVIDNYLEARDGDKDLGSATTVYGILPVPWKRVTSASFDELFRYWSDYTYVSEDGVTEAALTVERFTMFYTNPEEFMKLPVNI